MITTLSDKALIELIRVGDDAAGQVLAKRYATDPVKAIAAWRKPPGRLSVSAARRIAAQVARQSR